MDDYARWEWRNRLFGAYCYIAPAILLSAAAWLGWDRLRYDFIREALVIWPATALIAGMVGSVFAQPFDAGRAYLMPAAGHHVLAGLACWLVAWEQPVSGIYMSATLTGWAIAAHFAKAALRHQEAKALIED